MTDNNTLWFVVDTEDVTTNVNIKGDRAGQDTGGGYGKPPLIDTVKTLAKRQRISLDAQALKTQMSSMLAMMDAIFQQASTRTGLQLEEVELSVEINAEGQLSIVGNGGKVGNTGGMTLKFTRPQI